MGKCIKSPMSCGFRLESTVSPVEYARKAWKIELGAQEWGAGPREPPGSANSWARWLGHGSHYKKEALKHEGRKECWFAEELSPFAPQQNPPPSPLGWAFEGDKWCTPTGTGVSLTPSMMGGGQLPSVRGPSRPAWMAMRA